MRTIIKLFDNKQLIDVIDLGTHLTDRDFKKDDIIFEKTNMKVLGIWININKLEKYIYCEAVFGKFMEDILGLEKPNYLEIEKRFGVKL